MADRNGEVHLGYNCSQLEKVHLQIITLFVSHLISDIQLFIAFCQEKKSFEKYGNIVCCMLVENS